MPDNRDDRTEDIVSPDEEDMGVDMGVEDVGTGRAFGKFNEPGNAEVPGATDGFQGQGHQGQYGGSGGDGEPMRGREGGRESVEQGPLERPHKEIQDYIERRTAELMEENAGVKKD